MMIIEHLENNLGHLCRGINLKDRTYNLSVGLFKNQPFLGVNTLTTIGLSNYSLDIFGKVYFIELVLGFEDYYDESLVAKFMLSFSEFLIRKKRAPSKGDVFDFDETIIPNSRMSSFYVTNPIFYKKGFQGLKTKDKNIIFPWIFPIHNSESLYIKRNGWEKFEDYLEEKQIDSFWDLNREDFF